MRILRRRSLVLALSLVLLAAGAFWATSALAAKPERAMLPHAGLKNACPEGAVGASVVAEKYDDSGPHPGHDAVFEGVGEFTEKDVHADNIMVEFGQPYLSPSGQKIVPFKILSIGGHAFAEGIGETRFWLDTSRPVMSAIWEKKSGTEFPAIQEMRFHFFYTLEAMPGKIFRSMNPSIMRSENVRAFPPPPGTMYTLVRTVSLEDIDEPGVVAGKLLSNQLMIPGERPKPHVKP